MADIDLVIQSQFADHSARHEDGGADALDVTGLSGVLADQQDPQSHGNARHTANYIPDSEIGVSNGVASLNGNGVLSAGQVPDLAITEVFTVATESDLTTQSDAEIGDVGILTDASADTNNAFILTGDYATQSNWVALQTPTSPVQSVNGYTGDVVLASGDVGAPSDSEFSNHSARHENGGADEISVEGLSGSLADAQEPTAHSTEHESDGSDEINVGGLSGELADPQEPKSHDNASHTTNYADDAHDHSATGEGAQDISPNSVDASSQLDPPTVATRSDIPTGQTGIYYVEDEDTLTYRVS